MSEERITGDLGQRLASVIGSASASGWRLIHTGKELGPMSLGELIDKASVGEIDADDLVKQGDGNWTRAGAVATLQEHFPLRAIQQEIVQKLPHYHKPTVGKGRTTLNTAQRWIVGVGAGIVLVLAVFVPWNRAAQRGGSRVTTPMGYGLIFAPPKAQRKIPPTTNLLPQALAHFTPEVAIDDEYSSVEVNVPMVLIPIGAMILGAAVAFFIAGSLPGPAGQSRSSTPAAPAPDRCI